MTARSRMADAVNLGPIVPSSASDRRLTDRHRCNRSSPVPVSSERLHADRRCNVCPRTILDALQPPQVDRRHCE
jgi:hypothetical protein